MRTVGLKPLLKKIQHRTQAFACCLSVAFLFVAFSPAGFAKSKIDGVWEGTIENPKLPLIFHIKMKELCTVDSPTQAIQGMPIYVRMSGKAVYINMMNGVVTYEGTLESSSRIVGTFSQAGSKYPLALTKSKKHE